MKLGCGDSCSDAAKCEKNSAKRFASPAWHWSLTLPESRFVPARYRNKIAIGLKRMMCWDVGMPAGFSFSGRLSYLSCRSADLRRQKRRLASLGNPYLSSSRAWCSLAHGFSFPYAIRVNAKRQNSVKCWVFLTDGKKPLGYAQRTFDFVGGKVSHDYLAFVSSAQGRGYGSQVLANAMAVYQRFGVSQIRLTAGLSSGSAVWPRLGFMPISSEEWRKLRQQIAVNASRLPIEVHEGYGSYYNGRSLERAIDLILDDDDPRAIFDIAAIDHKKKMRGKFGVVDLTNGIESALLAGGHWKGFLDINGVGGDRLRTYLKASNVSSPSL